MVRDLVKEFHWELRPAVDERIHLDIVEVAAGNVDKVRELIGLAKLDWRDLIVVAEYDSVDGKLFLNDRGWLRLREMASQQSQSQPKTSQLP